MLQAHILAHRIYRAPHRVRPRWLNPRSLSVRREQFLKPLFASINDHRQSAIDQCTSTLEDGQGIEQVHIELDVGINLPPPICGVLAANLRIILTTSLNCNIFQFCGAVRRDSRPVVYEYQGLVMRVTRLMNVPALGSNRRFA